MIDYGFFSPSRSGEQNTLGAREIGRVGPVGKDRRPAVWTTKLNTRHKGVRMFEVMYVLSFEISKSVLFVLSVTG